MTVIQLRAHGPIGPQPEFRLVGAVGVHRPHGQATGLVVIDGSAASATPRLVGGLAEAGSTDQSQGRESREFASCGFNCGISRWIIVFICLFPFHFWCSQVYFRKSGGI